jgi:transposase-like protein
MDRTHNDFMPQGVEHRSASVRIVRISQRRKPLDKLPPPDTKRWVMRRKAQVVAGVKGGLLTVEEACERYSISEEEFRSWTKLMEGHGMRGLRTTRLRDYRDAGEIRSYAE